MSNPGRFDVDIKSIRRRLNFDEFPRHFHVLFRCNFADRRIHVVSTYSFWRDSLVEKSMLFPRTFLDAISMVEKPTLFPRTFFDRISMVEKSTLFPCVLFRCSLSGRNIQDVFAYFFRCAFNGQKFNIVFGKL